MDQRTKDFLTQINENESRKLEGRMVTRKDVYAEERESMKRMLKDNRTPPKARKQIEEMLKNPELYKQDVTMNEQTTQELSEKVEYEIKKAIKTGKIPPPDVDDFMNKIYGNKTR